MKTVHCFIIALCVIVLSCGGGTRPSVRDGGDTVTFKYARLLQVVRCDGYTLVDVGNPWQRGKSLHRYVLVPRDSSVADLPHGTVVRVPLQRVIPFSTVHAGLMVTLGCGQAIVGITDLQYVKIPAILRQCRAGNIVDVGNSMSPNIERLLDTSPDAVLVSPFENSGGYGKLDGTGIPLIECADYMETSALGRAEWIRFYGMLFGTERQADSLFAVVDRNYHALKTKAATSSSRPSMIMDKRTGAVWYVPGGCSTMGAMIADANIAYAFSADTNSGSLALPFETVLDKAGNSALWLFRYSGNHPVTYSDILDEYHGYSELLAVRERRCYGCNVGQSRFYEETPFRPDYLLADFIKIAHPDVKGFGSLRYFHPVANK